MPCLVIKEEGRGDLEGMEILGKLSTVHEGRRNRETGIWKWGGGQNSRKFQDVIPGREKRGEMVELEGEGGG